MLYRENPSSDSPRQYHGVRTVVRVTPKEDKDSNPAEMLQIKTSYGSVPREIYLPMISTFRFDQVFDQLATQQDIYDALCPSLLEKWVNGYHGCIMAYGQTGTGKTHTLSGPAEDPGLIPQMIQRIFGFIKKSESMHSKVHVSYLEIFNERLRDLLHPPHAPQHKLDIREHPEYGTFIPHLTEKKVTSAQELLHTFRVGNKLRALAETKMNKHSTRSHCLLRFTCEGLIRDSRQEEPARFRSMLNVVDMAGSERATRNEPEGDRLLELRKINQSLHSLSHCIMCLVKKRFVPWRSSKLTHLLKDSIAGNKTFTLIATASPCTADLLETKQTLSFVARAAMLPVVPVRVELHKNFVRTDVEIILDLRKQIAQLNENMRCQGKARMQDHSKRRRLTDKSMVLESLLEKFTGVAAPARSRTEGHSRLSYAVQRKIHDARVADGLEELGIKTITTNPGDVDAVAPRINLITASDLGVPHITNLASDSPTLAGEVVFALTPGTSLSVGTAEFCTVVLSPSSVAPYQVMISSALSSDDEVVPVITLQRVAQKSVIFANEADSILTGGRSSAETIHTSTSPKGGTTDFTLQKDNAHAHESHDIVVRVNNSLVKHHKPKTLRHRDRITFGTVTFLLISPPNNKSVVYPTAATRCQEVDEAYLAIHATVQDMRLLDEVRPACNRLAVELYSRCIRRRSKSHTQVFRAWLEEWAVWHDMVASTQDAIDILCELTALPELSLTCEFCSDPTTDIESATSADIIVNNGNVEGEATQLPQFSVRVQRRTNNGENTSMALFTAASFYVHGKALRDVASSLSTLHVENNTSKPRIHSNNSFAQRSISEVRDLFTTWVQHVERTAQLPPASNGWRWARATRVDARATRQNTLVVLDPAAGERTYFEEKAISDDDDEWWSDEKEDVGKEGASIAHMLDFAEDAGLHGPEFDALPPRLTTVIIDASMGIMGPLEHRMTAAAEKTLAVAGTMTPTPPGGGVNGGRASAPANAVECTEVARMVSTVQHIVVELEGRLRQAMSQQDPWQGKCKEGETRSGTLKEESSPERQVASTSSSSSLSPGMQVCATWDDGDADNFVRGKQARGAQDERMEVGERGGGDGSVIKTKGGRAKEADKQHSVALGEKLHKIEPHVSAGSPLKGKVGSEEKKRARDARHERKRALRVEHKLEWQARLRVEIEHQMAGAHEKEKQALRTECEAEKQVMRCDIKNERQAWTRALEKGKKSMVAAVEEEKKEKRVMEEARAKERSEKGVTDAALEKMKEERQSLIMELETVKESKAGAHIAVKEDKEDKSAEIWKSEEGRKGEPLVQADSFALHAELRRESAVSIALLAELEKEKVDKAALQVKLEKERKALQSELDFEKKEKVGLRVELGEERESKALLQGELEEEKMTQWMHEMQAMNEQLHAELHDILDDAKQTARTG
eukprot:GEMP01000824.1.p1 GENE.GEMP01000824.1~~GEMP01000824.1.p1  ORF type:complete len:1426 (+),score=381.43 GEMP01000824.1:80-4357(+)